MVRRLSLILIPALFCVAAWRTGLRDQFYAYGDPDIGYIFNSLLIAEGRPVVYVDHPGTLLQLIGAAWIWVFRLWSGQTDMLRLVVNNLNQVYFGIVSIQVGIFAACQLILGTAMYRRSYSLLQILAVQLTPALVSAFPLYLVRINSETLMAALGLLLAATMLPFLEKRFERPNLNSVLLGAAVGAMLTSKANVLPLAAAALLFPLFSKSSPIFRSCAALISAIIVFGLITIPAWAKLEYLLGWLQRLLLHSGHYGSGPQTFTSMASLWEGASFYMMSEAWLTEILGLMGGVIILIFAVVRKRFIYAPVLFALIAITILVLKHPNQRYLVALVPCIAVALLSLRNETAIVRLPIFATVIILSTIGFWGRIDFTRAQHQYAVQTYTEATDAIDRHGRNCAIVFLTAVPTLEAGVIGGNIFAKGWNSQLELIFPRHGSWANFGAYRFDNLLQNSEWESFLNSFPCQVFVGLGESAGWLSRQIGDKFEIITPPGKNVLFKHLGRVTLREVLK